MFQSIVIGNLGADAQVKGEQGREFISFRVAHTDRWTDDAGQQHSTTTWVDCAMNGRPKVLEYLKKGVTVCVIGNGSLRVYSSAKDRCMKAGLQLNVRSIELVSGKSADVPSRLYDKDGIQHDVKPYYMTDVKSTTLFSQGGGEYIVNQDGWVAAAAPQAAGEQQAEEPKQEYDGF